MNNLPLVNTKEKYDYTNFALDCGKLTENEFGMYCALIRHVDDKLGYAYPSYEDLMKKLNITSRNTINKRIKALEEKGFIVKAKGTVNQNNRYYFVHPKDIDVSQIELKEKDTNKTNRFNNKNTDVSQNELLTYHDMIHTDVSQYDTLKENIKENIKENNNNISNEIKTKKLFNGLFSNNEEKEKECHSFTNVQELDTLKENTSKTTNNDNSTLIETYGDIFSFDDVEEIPYYNENECAYENVTDENEHQLSTTELIEMYGTDDNTIQDNPYIRQWIVNEMLSIIDYTTANEKVQDNLNDWLEYHKHLIKYFRRELNKNYDDYEWITDKIDNKNKRLNVMKSQLLKECQEWYDRNSETNAIEVLDDVDVPPFCLYQ